MRADPAGAVAPGEAVGRITPAAAGGSGGHFHANGELLRRSWLVLRELP